MSKCHRKLYLGAPDKKGHGREEGKSGENIIFELSLLNIPSN